ncbi:type IV pilin [Oceanisphaera marina]|uniref:Type IV pilin n=1 Tax=Oceanisphaera marina TaxID=2017550 RepID=A0ABQ1IDE1_9GAMM|nr:prepilin-type N-terminal cleavage/methylation domain-containing protein [Oceanisphaera marina]GGB36046.1 type IV pilin [Oceanisphaera marina]
MLSRSRGFSVIELLIAMVAGVLVLAGALSLFSTVLASGNTTLMLSRLNQEVQGIGDMISRDLQKTGYHPDIAAGLAAHYAFSVTDDLYTEPGASGQHCVRIKYWDASSPSDKQARVRIYSHNRGTRQLKVRIAHNAADATALSELCGSGSKLISSEEISVDRLSVVPVSGADSPSLQLTITASHTQRSDLTMSLQRHVYLRNQRVVP